MVDDTISSIKTKNFKAIFDITIFLNVTETEINESYSIAIKNKNNYIDIYTLYIITYLISEIYNKKLE